MSRKTKKIVGVDLSGRDGKASGFCLIYNATITAVGEFKTLKYLLEYLLLLRPDIVAIDSPLGYPAEGPYRDCDLLLKKEGLSPLPLNMLGMQQLIRRAIIIVRNLEKKTRAICIETFPFGALRLLGFKRKPRNFHERKKYFGIIRTLFNLKSIVDANRLTKDEFDAFICAVAGYAFSIGKYKEYLGKDCRIILPKSK